MDMNSAVPEFAGFQALDIIKHQVFLKGLLAILFGLNQSTSPKETGLIPDILNSYNGMGRSIKPYCP